MDDFKFDKQISLEIFRKWFILLKKDPSQQYDQDQIDDLFQTHKLQVGYLFQQLENYELHTFRAEIPFLFINYKKFHQFNVEVLIIGNTIDCLNIPGCMVEGETRMLAFNNLIKAVIQCSDARIKNGLFFLNRVFPVLSCNPHLQPIDSEHLIKQLKKDGWPIEYRGQYHTVLLRHGSKVTYTIPNNSNISSDLHFNYIRLQRALNYNDYINMYGDVDDNLNWSCDICDGNSSTGCLYFDPTECPR